MDKSWEFGVITILFRQSKAPVRRQVPMIPDVAGMLCPVSAGKFKHVETWGFEKILLGVYDSLWEFMGVWNVYHVEDVWTNVGKTMSWTIPQITMFIGGMFTIPNWVVYYCFIHPHGFVWKCWVNIPNEIAMFYWDNDQQNHWVQWGTLFSDTPIYIYNTLCSTIIYYDILWHILWQHFQTHPHCCADSVRGKLRSHW